MSEKLGQESAFACTAQLNNGEAIYEPGMSKRFYAACAAMQGLIQSGWTDVPSKNELIKRSYEFADELLKQENNGS